MRILLDAHISPSIARWIREEHGHEASSLRSLGLRDAKDREVLARASLVADVVISKDEGLIRLIERKGPPPRAIWLTCGNTSNAALRVILDRRLAAAVSLLEQGEVVVEISGGGGT